MNWGALGDRKHRIALLLILVAIGLASFACWHVCHHHVAAKTGPVAGTDTGTDWTLWITVIGGVVTVVTSFIAGLPALISAIRSGDKSKIDAGIKEVVDDAEKIKAELDKLKQKEPPKDQNNS